MVSPVDCAVPMAHDLLNREERHHTGQDEQGLAKKRQLAKERFRNQMDERMAKLIRVVDNFRRRSSLSETARSPTKETRLTTATLKMLDTVLFIRAFDRISRRL